jgi:hypothetical protein
MKDKKNKFEKRKSYLIVTSIKKLNFDKINLVLQCLNLT